MTPDIRAMREATGLTIPQAAKRLGTDQGNLSRIERGKQRLMIDMARKMAGLYGVSVDQLVGGPIEDLKKTA
jgi:transcriptional regulator with XRE-family HTH domain